MLTYIMTLHSYTCMCSVQFRNLWNLKIVLCILKIQKLHASLKTVQLILRLHKTVEITQFNFGSTVSRLRMWTLGVLLVFPLAAIAQSLASTAVGSIAFREMPIQNLTTLLWSLLCMDSDGKVVSIVMITVVYRQWWQSCEHCNDHCCVWTVVAKLWAL